MPGPFHVDAPPFALGTTLLDTADATSQERILGLEYFFEDLDLSVDPPTRRTGHYKKCRIVRNGSGGTLYPKRVVQSLASTENKNGLYAGANSSANAGHFLGVVDEFLPSTGVASNGIFWLTMEGPTKCRTPSSNLAANLAINDRVVPAAAGCFVGQDLSGATSALANNVQNVLGRVCNNVTLSSTDTDVLVLVRHP